MNENKHHHKCDLKKQQPITPGEISLIYGTSASMLRVGLNISAKTSD